MEENVSPSLKIFSDLSPFLKQGDQKNPLFTKGGGRTLCRVSGEKTIDSGPTFAHRIQELKLSLQNRAKLL